MTRKTLTATAIMVTRLSRRSPARDNSTAAMPIANMAAITAEMQVARPQSRRRLIAMLGRGKSRENQQPAKHPVSHGEQGRELFVVFDTGAAAGSKIFSRQQRRRRDSRKNVSRQLGLRCAEKQDRHHHPDEKKERPGIRARKSLLITTRVTNFDCIPQQASALHYSQYQHKRPRHRRQQEHRQIKPEWLAMVIDILRKAGKIVLKNKHAEEFRIAQLNQNVPRQHHNQIERNTRNPECTDDGTPVPLQSNEQKNNHCRQGGRNRTFGQSPERQRDVKEREINFPPALIPRIPAKQER